MGKKNDLDELMEFLKKFDIEDVKEVISRYREEATETEYPALEEVEEYPILEEPSGVSLEKQLVSGRFSGEMVFPVGSRGSYMLDLRVDINPRHPNSPVMYKISGDIYQVYRKPKVWNVYRESWIVDKPMIRWSKDIVRIFGVVRYFQNSHPRTYVKVYIPWSYPNIGPALVGIREHGQTTTDIYSCEKRSNAFRDVTLEVDVCKSVNSEPILPRYDTDAHTNRPATIPRRKLTIEEAYNEAGIALNINPKRSIIDDSSTRYNTWSDSELHDAMEIYFSHYPGNWPKWHLWCLFAGSYDSAGIVGIMFDYGVYYGGPGRAPERQGCAIFRNHWVFNNLVQNPSNDSQAWAMRQLLYTYVHEIGHAFNFVHSWNKGRPNALSWMNYPQNYDSVNGAGTFWANFFFRFDDKELVHIRHGDRASVIMGGDAWASGGHLEAPGANVEMAGEAPLEVTVRSKQYFEYMEPVIVELKVKNVSDAALALDSQISPEFGSVDVFIQRPDGKIVRYEPVMEKLATPEIMNLEPNGRYCTNVRISFGRQGHYFAEPGSYRIRAVYYGLGDLLIPSGVHEVRIAHPYSSKQERDGAGFYSGMAGMAMYLGGSDSQFLVDGMKALKNVAENYRESAAGAQMELLLAKNLTRPFRSVVDGKRVEVRAPNTAEAINLLDAAMRQHERDETTFTNLTYHECRRAKAQILVSIGKKNEAKTELKGLVEYLRSKGVKDDILEEIGRYSKGIQ